VSLRGGQSPTKQSGKLNKIVIASPTGRGNPEEKL